ncbi:hypothetical protein [Paludisphaera mucosa]|uniref:Neutral/alkaline non-lysosomal ceramidase N-terminal domain-containing protein n=1 Tax=Paludisphaera mucosa TaxID=3030827 RepID=A0ABT6FIW3_9BACT|nr:hypothetical protein [Paludisphaera mucosa]MDG3007474.1 hypothetical protein [Paludisphaera mucosa]
MLNHTRALDAPFSRRDVLGVLAAAISGPRALSAGREAGRPWELFTFSADVTPPIGHPCMGGGIAAVKGVADPLEAIGLVLRGGSLEKPVVLVAVDWCEIRNDAYDRWREAIAEAAGTDPRCVLLSAVHQHDAPIADLEAERILERHGCAGRVCNLAFHSLVVGRVARAVAKAVAKPPRRVTHVGVGRAKAERVASSRRYVRPDGTVVHDRTSASKDPRAREADEGLIDPFVTVVGFWEGDEPLAAFNHFAIHPMSYYGKGEVSADFVGMARRARQKALPGVVQVYASGCGGDVTAGKYNDGDPARRPELAARLEDAMARAWDAARREPLEHAALRIEPLKFTARDDAGFTEADLNARLLDHAKPFGQCLAAMGLSWRKRLADGRPIDLPALDLGPVVLVLCPGETYVAYQLLAQKLRPDKVVVAIGYGDAATGYIPTADRVAEDDSNLRDWCWVGPDAEAVLTKGLEAALKPGA